MDEFSHSQTQKIYIWLGDKCDRQLAKLGWERPKMGDYELALQLLVISPNIALYFDCIPYEPLDRHFPSLHGYC